MNITKSLTRLGNSIGHEPYFGFVKGHDHLSNIQINEIENLVGKNVQEINEKFEIAFASKIGEGKAISFAAGRMGFFSLMQSLNIGQGDEVIIQGHTCSVMPNAVLRIGAKPVFADIEVDTFGSCAEKIEKVITNKTKMIVAQHSFGIPCNIEPIVELSKEKGIFLLEDCALTLGSKIKGVQVGNFGDAALFSIDHSKPINACLGGLIYTKNKDHYRKLKKIQLYAKDLSLIRQNAIWNKFLFERLNYNPKRYRKSYLIDLIKKFTNSSSNATLGNDYGKHPSTRYPYPAKLPSFLAKIGLFELTRWNSIKKKRQSLLAKFIEYSNNLGISDFIPSSYFDNKRTIVPLRFVYTYPKAPLIKKNISKYIDTNWFWFQKPIIVCKDPMDFGYVYNSCPVSERVGREIINWPCVFTDQNNLKLLNYFEKVHA